MMNELRWLLENDPETRTVWLAFWRDRHAKSGPIPWGKP